jgi:hypothetical protein
VQQCAAMLGCGVLLNDAAAASALHVDSINNLHVGWNMCACIYTALRLQHVLSYVGWHVCVGQGTVGLYCHVDSCVTVTTAAPLCHGLHVTLNLHAHETYSVSAGHALMWLPSRRWVPSQQKQHSSGVILRSL